MAKIQIKSEKLTPFGGIFSIMEQFDALLAQTIDSTLGLRCTMFGYQYSEILRSLMCVYLCGGSCIEDVTTHLMKHLSLHPTLRTCSADTILRAIEELTCKNITYKSASGNSYDFNTADKMNCLLIKALLATGQLKSGQEYDFDFDHQFIETEKHDAKPTYKKFLGYSPGVAVINDMIVGIENRDGNTNVRFNQRETLERIFKRLEASEVYISRARMDCGSCSEEIRFLSGVSILQLSFKESIFTGFALQLLYHKNGGGGMSRVTKALRNMPEAMTLIHGYCI